MSEQQYAQVFDQVAASLTTQGLPAEWYLIPGFRGYQDLVGGPSDVHCLEICLGQAHNNPDYLTYAIAQTFTSKYPSLAFLFLVDLRKTDRQPSSTPARFSVEIDRAFSCICLPTLFTAFNALDPSGQQRGLLVQSYHSEMLLADLIQSSAYTVNLLLRFKRDGQLALIAVDYYDAGITLIANVINVFAHIFKIDIYQIPKTPHRSSVQVPVRKTADGYYLITDYSTALDQGVQLAYSLFDKHYDAVQRPETAREISLT